MLLSTYPKNHLKELISSNIPLIVTTAEYQKSQFLSWHPVPHLGVLASLSLIFLCLSLASMAFNIMELDGLLLSSDLGVWLGGWIFLVGLAIVAAWVVACIATAELLEIASMVLNIVLDRSQTIRY